MLKHSTAIGVAVALLSTTAFAQASQRPPGPRPPAQGVETYRDALPGQARHHATADNGIGPATMTCELSRVPLRPRAHDGFLVFSGIGKAAHQSKARRGECVYRRAEAGAVRAIASGSQHKAMRAISQRTVCSSSPPVLSPAYRFSGRPASDTGRGRRALRPPWRTAVSAPRATAAAVDEQRDRQPRGDDLAGDPRCYKIGSII
jgi:hypothetical protein